MNEKHDDGMATPLSDEAEARYWEWKAHNLNPIPNGFNYARSQERRAILAERRRGEMERILKKLLEFCSGTSGDNDEYAKALQAAEGLLLESPKDSLAPQGLKPPHGTAEGSLAS